jgi:hypothetical protein
VLRAWHRWYSYVAVGMVIIITGWLRRLRDGVRQIVGMLDRERNGLLAGAKRRVLTVRLRSEQRNNKLGRSGIGVYRACRFGAEC